MTKLKKIGAIILAVMMMAMVATAFASGNTGDADGKLTDGKDGYLFDDADEGKKDSNTLTFKKEIVLFNTTSAEVHHPVVTYTYTIGSVNTSGKSVTDGEGDTGNVYPGVAEAASITSSVAFINSDSETEVTDKGKVASKDITVTIDPSKFTHAGIYRYLITEGDNSTARANAGVSRGDNYVATRYLDVYVRRAVTTDSVETNYVVYGYVLFKGADTTITQNETEVTKSQGFVATVTNGQYEKTDVDYYKTYNLKVIKNIEGELAETAHTFPFSVTFNSPVTTNAVIEWAKNGDATTEATISNQALTVGDTTTGGCNSSAIKLSDEQYVIFYGIPAQTTSVVSEINDTYDIYKASKESIVGGSTATVDATNLAANHVNASIYPISTVTNETTVTTNSKADTVLTVKNEIAIVSPTGYVARFAPYALILIGGIALLLISRKHKKHADEE